MKNVKFGNTFGDRRLDCRCEDIMQGMIKNKTAVLHRISSSRSSYVSNCNLMKNEKVDYLKIFSPIRDQVAQNCEGQDIIVISDTTELNFQRHSNFLKKSDPDLGPVGNNIDVGFFSHVSIVCNEKDGTLLGLGDIYNWNRSFDKLDKNQRDYKKLPMEEKESFRWIESATRIKQVFNKANQITLVSDRESDIYREFADVPDYEKYHIIIRSKENRIILNHDLKLYDFMKTQPILGNIETAIRQTSLNQPNTRNAKLSIRIGEVQIKKPENSIYQNAELPKFATLNCVMAIEEKSSGSKISWTLLTSRPVNTLQDAIRIIEIYKQRWWIETIFATLKRDGIDYERCELETGRALKNIVVLALYTAVRINQLRLGRNDTRPGSAKIVFTELQIKLIEALIPQFEGKTEKQRNNHPKDTLARVAWLIARLGGWKGYDKESPPGIKTFTLGLDKFLSTEEIFTKLQNVNPKIFA
jgi:hypothetical protein